MRTMISGLDIYRAANLLINRYGAGAPIEAARMIDRMLELGDPEGRRCGAASGTRSRCCKQAQAGQPVQDVPSSFEPDVREQAEQHGSGNADPFVMNETIGEIKNSVPSPFSRPRNLTRPQSFHAATVN